MQRLTLTGEPLKAFIEGRNDWVWVLGIERSD